MNGNTRKPTAQDLVSLLSQLQEEVPSSTIYQHQTQGIERSILVNAVNVRTTFIY